MKLEMYEEVLILTFKNIAIERRKFHHLKNQILLEDVDADKIQVSSLTFFGEESYKYFISFKDDDDYVIKPLCIMFQKTSSYVKRYDCETKRMISIKVGNRVEKELDSEPIYIKTFLETKIRSYGDEATNFHGEKYLKKALIIFLGFYH